MREHIREGIRNIDDMAFGLKIFGRLCVTAHAIGLAGMILFLTMELADGAPRYINDEDLVTSILQVLGAVAVALTALATFVSVAFNRPIMFCALRMLTNLESAIATSRNRRLRRGTGDFLNLVPFSILIPPGDMLGIALLLILIRSNTDHLEKRQGEVFQQSAIVLGIGSALQCAAFLLIFLTWQFTFHSGAILLGIGIAWHVITLAGVICVERSLRAMHRELGESVNRIAV